MTGNLKSQAKPTQRVNVSDWYPVLHEKAPDIFRWAPVSIVASGLMLCLSPVQGSSRVLFGGGAVLLSVVVFVVGWEAGRSQFALHCDSYRRLSPHRPLRFLFPVLAAAVISLGLIGGRWWWLLSPALAFLGHRKGTQRAWWTAVVFLAFSLRSQDTPSLPPVAGSDEEALTLASDAINDMIGIHRKKDEK